MLFALLVLLFSNVDALTNTFKVDTHAEYHDGWFWGWRRIEHSGTGCQLCVKNGVNGHTECKGGPSNSATAWYINFEYANVAWDTWMWTSCTDALLIDQATLWDLNSSRNWGRDEGNMWCMSEDINDVHGWEGYRGDNRCYRLLLFAADGKTYYYHNFWYTPDGRRALDDHGAASDDDHVPSAADFNACEADETMTHEQCEDLVDLIIQNAINHPERKEETGTSPVNTESPARSMAMTVTSTSAVESWAIYGFAAVGFMFVMLQSAKALKKQMETGDDAFTPVKSRDEL